MTDFRGSVVGEVDLDGNVDEISYDAWGEPTFTQETDLEGLSILWNGYYYDDETGNYYLRNRFYSPQERCFITEDPRGINPNGNWNNRFAVNEQYTDGYGLSVYAGFDPVNGRDDWGLYMDWFKSDWAGRAILWRWLTGGGDWDISDSKWASYMKADELLKTNIASKLTYIASSLYRHKTLRSEHKRIDITFAAYVENGESITGYNYLHGTNATVGDFKVIGFVDKKSKKCDCKIKFSLDYVWNDKIDPNKEYWTDRVKSAVAEYYFLGLPEDYRISIKWHTNPEYNVIKRQKTKVVMKGWPFK